MKKKFDKFDFKKFHPSGNLGNKLKTAGDLMLIKKKNSISKWKSNYERSIKNNKLKRSWFYSGY